MDPRMTLLTGHDLADLHHLLGQDLIKLQQVFTLLLLGIDFARRQSFVFLVIYVYSSFNYILGIIYKNPRLTLLLIGASDSIFLMDSTFS